MYLSSTAITTEKTDKYLAHFLFTVWGKIIQHVDEFSKFYISRLHTITKYGLHINNSMKGLNI